MGRLKTKGKTQRAQAMTLVELMVSVGIVALLVAMLVPALGAARERARRVFCLGQLRQASVAVVLYTGENQYQLPPYFYSWELAGDGQYRLGIKDGWHTGNIGPGATLPLLVCPSDRSPSPIATTTPDGQPLTVTASYAYNFTIMARDERVTSVRPARTALLFDGNPEQALADLWWGVPDLTPGAGGKVTICHNGHALHVSPSAIGADPGGHAPGPKNHPPCFLGLCQGSDAANRQQFNDNTRQLLERRHSRKANILFLDGHTEWLAELPPDSIFAR